MPTKSIRYAKESVAPEKTCSYSNLNVCYQGVERNRLRDCRYFSSSYRSGPGHECQGHPPSGGQINQGLHISGISLGDGLGALVASKKAVPAEVMLIRGGAGGRRFKLSNFPARWENSSLTGIFPSSRN